LSSRHISWVVDSAHEDPVDSVPIHIHDFEAIGTSFEDIASSRHAPKSEHRQATKRVLVLSIVVADDGLCVQNTGYGIEGEPAVEQPATIVATHNHGLLVMLGREFADD
jgi:hypothetical protein